MPEQPALDDRQHASELLKVLDLWRPLRLAERTRLHVLARVDPRGQAAAILAGLREHGRPAAGFVASQTGSSQSMFVLWWIEGQLADDYSRDDETANRFDEVRLIVDNALLQTEGQRTPGTGMSDSGTILIKVERLKELLVLRSTNQQQPRDEQEYAKLRRELMAISGMRSALPEVVRRCGTIREFWISIKDLYEPGEKHKRRGEYLQQEFQPILAALEESIPSNEVGTARSASISEAGRTARMIKVLLLSANPLDAPLSIDEEFRAIDAKIRGSEHRDYVELIKHGAVRLEDIPGLLMRHKPHVVHFSGHGDAAGIELTSATGSGQVPPNALADIFQVLRDNVRVVLLNACDSAPQAEAIVSVIDCAVGMSDQIEDGAAIAFAAAFYETLGYGRSVQDAFNLALVQLTGAGADRSLAKLYQRRGVKPSDVVLVTPQRPR